MIKAFWTWNPVCSGEFRRFDEPYMLQNNSWLWNRRVWTDMFQRMAEFGFNSMVFANTHPFPFMIDYQRFPEARMLDESELARYQKAYHWIFNEGKRFGIDTYLLFFSVYYPEPMLDHLGVYDRAAYAVTDLSLDYTSYCVRELLRAYPELAGIIGEASENISGSKPAFIKPAIVEPFKEEAAGKKLILRGWWSDINEFKSMADESGLDITFSVKYTWEHLVHPNPDPLFTDWLNTVGAQNVMAEFWISNIEPFTCFAYSTVRGILDNLTNKGCTGFSLHPLSIYEWPFTSDHCWEYQFERDASYYCAWGESDVLPEEQRVLVEDEQVRLGLEAASQILQLAALYFAGDRQNQWRPQFCSVRHSDGVRLLTIPDMCNLRGQVTPWGGGMWPAFDCLDWRTTFTGQPTMHWEDFDPSNTEAYGPVQFIEEMDELASQAEIAVALASEKYNSPTQQCLLNHASAKALLGRFWAERGRAGLAHISGDHTLAAEHIQHALGFFRELEALEATHKNSFRTLTGRCTHANNWDSPRLALEQELADYRNGIFGKVYPAGSTEHRDTSTHPRGKFEWK